MKTDILLSIVTPTYNRGKLLQKCFASLKAQTDLRFEWIIVDDGSTDDTAEIAAAFSAEAPEMSIYYVHKENGGKHTAINASHPYIHGKYVLILDSDDTLTPDAVELALKGWERYKHDVSIAIVIFLRGYSKDDPFCYSKDENVPVDIMSYPRVRIHSSDACEVVKADVLREYPFPVFPGERFLSEGSLWWRLSFSYRCVYINQVIYLCEYLEGGLTKSGKPLRIKNPLGGMDNANLKLAKKNPLKMRIKNGLLYTAYGFFANKSPREMAKSCSHKALMWLCLPAGWLLYLHWKKKWMNT